MGLLDGLLKLYIFDQMTTMVIFCIMGIVMVALLLGVIFYDMNTNHDANETVQDNNPHNYKLKIISDGKWEGSFSSDNVKIKKISETGDETIDLGKSMASNVDINIEKADGSEDKLTAKLYSDGELVDEDSTTIPRSSLLITA